MVNNNWSALATIWARIPEEPSMDDNSDIIDYLGQGELVLNYKIHNHNTSLRLIPGLKKQGIELTHSIPWKEGLRGYVKANYGYGQSLMDYDHNSQRVSIGFILADPFTNN